MITYDANGDEEVELYLCLACNGLFGNSDWSVGPKPPNPDKACELVQAELGWHDSDAYALWHDVKLLFDLAEQLSPDSTAGSRALVL